MVTKVTNIHMIAMATFVTIFTLITKITDVWMVAIVKFFTIVTFVTQVTSDPIAVITGVQWLFGATKLPVFQWFFWLHLLQYLP